MATSAEYENISQDDSEHLNAATSFEICIAYDKHRVEAGSFLDQPEDKTNDAVCYLFRRLKDLGLIVEHVEGVAADFIKVAAPLQLIGHSAEKLRIKKATYLGLDVVFDWEQRDAFIRQPYDNSLFNWTERYHCLDFLLHTVVHPSDSPRKLKAGVEHEIDIKPGDHVLSVLRSAGVVKDVFPLHDEMMRKRLLDEWALNWGGLASQPIDAIYTYFGGKIAIYFTFLGMFTEWLYIPAILGVFIYIKELGFSTSSRTWELLMPLVFSMLAVVWSVLFLQFWKRKNAGLLTRWGMSLNAKEEIPDDFNPEELLQSSQSERILETQVENYQKKRFRKEEWLAQLVHFRNNAIVMIGLLFFQLPFELAYAHLNKIAPNLVVRLAITIGYLLLIQLLTTIGSKIAVMLTKTEHYATREARADALIYKVFGLYFLQSYIGLFYHALLHRDFIALRQFLAQRLVVSQIMNNVFENLVPYVTYHCAKFKAKKNEEELKSVTGEKICVTRIEEEFMRPSYTASIGDPSEDGVFDDILELALEFGMVTMFASSFPLVFVFALINNLMEIRSDSLKLLVMLRRPVPYNVSSIGAWLNIFQYLGVVAICTNCALLVCLYDQAGTWSLEPGLAAILVIEHLLLLAKFGFSCFVPEEPAWVKAKKERSARLQEHYSVHLLRSISKKHL